MSLIQHRIGSKIHKDTKNAVEADYHKEHPKLRYPSLSTTREEPDSSSEWEGGTNDQTNRYEYWNNDFKPLPSKQITLQNDANVESVERLMDIGEISRDHSISPAGTEMAVPSRIHKPEEDLENECQFLRKKNDQLTRENAELKKMMLQRNTTLEKEHSEQVKKTLQNHKSEKMFMEENHRHSLALLEKKHGEKVVHIQNSTKEEVSRMETDYNNHLRLIIERHEKLLKTVLHQHEEEKREMSSNFEVERREFHDEKVKLSSAMELQKNTFETRLKNLRIESENTKQRMTAEHRAAKDKIMKGFEDEKALMGSHLQELEDCEKTRIMGGQHSQELHKEDREIEKVEDLSSGDWTSRSRQQSYNRDIPSRPHSRGASTVLNYNDVGQLSARKQEYVARATDSPFFNLSSESVKQPPPVRKRFEEQDAIEKLRLEKEKVGKHRKLKGDVEGTLVKKAMSYRDLALGFQDLVSEIDDLSRVRWDNKREADWPFPDRVLCKSENARRSKQHIVQNTIWVILYERIFCTPFRVFGAEGKLMERDWIEKYGQGELPHPVCLIRQLSSTRFEVSGGPCTLSKAYQRFRKMEI